MRINDAYAIVGGGGERRAMDFYPTPTEVTVALLRFLHIPRGSVIWEPAAGDGAMADVLERFGYDVIKTDIQDGTDFLTAEDRRCDWIITNPPFRGADEFIRRAARTGKPFALLLKCQYWHAARRVPLYRDHTPSFILPLTWRPDFTGEGNSLLDMAWNVWMPVTNGDAVYVPLSKPRLLSP